MSHKDFWILVLKRLEPTIKRALFMTWFQNTGALDKKEGQLIVGVPNVFAKNWISDKYNLKVLQAAQEIDPEIKVIEYEVSSKLTDPGSVDAVDVKITLSEAHDKKVRKVRNQNEVTLVRGSSDKVVSRILNQRYRLNNFIVGGENRLPHAACNAVANMPGGIYNPLYIYGDVGLGKTHLLQAVGNEILRNYPDKIVKYVTAEKFVSEVVEAIKYRNMKKFKDFYRNVDCLLLDDVQFFLNKKSSQDEFFHTFNELYDANKQIVLTSDRPPSELDDLDARLTSRFGMGMVVELVFPEFETRLAILQEKCQDYQVLIDPEVLEFIANNVHHSVRELEGVLRQAVAETELHNSVPTIRSVAEIIKRMNKAQEIIGFDIEEKRAKHFSKSAQDVISIVAEYYDLSVGDLIGKDRHKEVMIPRQVCMYLIKNELDCSYEKIGTDFGGRNHTTVMNACAKTAQKLKKDVRLVRDLNAIKREMGL